MKSKIYKYLSDKSNPVSSKKIMEKFFHVFDPCPPQMAAIIDSILKDDPRFIRDEAGDWRANKSDEQQALTDFVFSIVEIDMIPIAQKSKIPALLGIAQLKNNKLISNSIFALEVTNQYSPQFKKKIAELQVNLLPEQSFSRNAERIYNDLDKTIIVGYAPSKMLAIINHFFRNQIGLELEGETISLVQLTRKLIPGIKIRSVEDIGNSLSIPFNSPLDLKNRLTLMLEILVTFLAEFQQLHIQSLADLRTFLETTKIWANFSSYNFNKDDIKNLPTTPGVYLMKDKQEQIFYVGKAKNLKARVESYFVNRFEIDNKTISMLSRLYDLTFEQVGSELEALLLENKYINQYKPELNTQINIHPFDISKYSSRRIILFLPGVNENQVVLFLVNGSYIAIKITINPEKKLDVEILKGKMQKLFFDNKSIDTDFSRAQIELLWRWFSIHYESISYLDIDQTGSFDNCWELTRRYCVDKKLLFEKVIYY